jgi:hypothetical protein
MPLVHRKKHQHEEDGSAEKEKEQQEQEERKSTSHNLSPVLITQNGKEKNTTSCCDSSSKNPRGWRGKQQVGRMKKRKRHTRGSGTLLGEKSRLEPVLSRQVANLKGGMLTLIPQVPPDWLDTDRQKGLSGSEAEERRKKVGYNELER